ncbi:unnamed protein product [Acanthoscelides obtectus]|uniref:Uncharacterized protein n=1 Tax=Acanthoscelides obtectus TaxID=200917 RepID=A0A9P0PC11_ACAOB|nr:unnamed protein product [Acanthoscelides obtectus]CAK1646449.1 hypothetical protein AOBTE_LOCUS14639 [Acanthoscelides obtectus]
MDTVHEEISPPPSPRFVAISDTETYYQPHSIPLINVNNELPPSLLYKEDDFSSSCQRRDSTPVTLTKQGFSSLITRRRDAASLTTLPCHRKDDHYSSQHGSTQRRDSLSLPGSLLHRRAESPPSVLQSHPRTTSPT